MRTALSWFGPAALALTLAMPAAAQTTYGSSQSAVTSADIQRLQDQVYDASTDVTRLRSRDSALADRLQNQLDDLRDEVVYLKVKLRKEGSVNPSDYNSVRTQVQDIRSQARGDTSSSSSSGARSDNSTWSTNSGSGSGSSNRPYGGSDNRAPEQNRSTRRGEIPSGQELDVRLDRELSSDTAQVEDRFNATTVADLYQGDEVLIPAGSTLRGVISSVQKATRTQRKGALTVAFDQITVRGRTYPMHGTVTQALESEGIKGEVGKIGAGSAVGAIIGGIIGGGKGALLGVLIGGGGTIAATEGKDVTLPVGTILRVRLDDSLVVR
jgi:TolA-binding protein